MILAWHSTGNEQKCIKKKHLQFIELIRLNYVHWTGAMLFYKLVKSINTVSASNYLLSDELNKPKSNECNSGRMCLILKICSPIPVHTPSFFHQFPPASHISLRFLPIGELFTLMPLLGHSLHSTASSCCCLSLFGPLAFSPSAGICYTERASKTHKTTRWRHSK